MTLLSTEDVLKQETSYLGKENIGGITCSVGYIKKFRWKWMATQMNLFVIIGETDQVVDKKMIENFSKNCFDFALKNNKGWPRGLQAVIGSVAVLKGSQFTSDATSYCRSITKNHWSAFEIPVLYHTEVKKHIRYTNTPLWGAIFFSYFSITIDSIMDKISKINN